MTKRPTTKAKAKSQSNPRAKTGKPTLPKGPLLAILPKPKTLPANHSRSRFSVRHPFPGETFPFETGVEYMDLRPGTCWVLTYDRKPVCLLVGVDAHGMFVFIRIVASPDSPANGMSVLLRQAFQDIRAMGCRYFTSYLMPETNDAELRLLRLVARGGGGCIETKGYWAVGDLSKIRRF